MANQDSPRIPVIAGPTAVGKTALGITLAERLDGEIISADSRQIYKQLTIGTAKPPSEVLAQVPHHFIDELDITKPFSAGLFAQAASKRIEEILGRGKRPIVVGGSTLYLEALLHGLANIPATTPETRERLMQRLELEGAAALYRELVEVDPASTATMDETKSHRIVRALEVYIDTGRPLSSYHAEQSAPQFRFSTHVLNRPRRHLYHRINTRVDAMLSAGLLEENHRLLLYEDIAALPVLKTIGYREPLAHLRGDIDHDEMIRLLKRNSRRYAKRQLTWFRRHDEYTWHEVVLSEEVADLQSEIVDAITDSL